MTTQDTGVAPQPLLDASVAASVPDAQQALPDAAPSALEPADLTLRLVSTSYEGELCPLDSLVASEAPDHGALTVTFSREVQAGGSSADVSEHCALTLGFDVPAGYTFANLHVYAMGYAGGSEGSADLTMRYGFAGQSAMQTAHFTELAEDYVEYGRFDEPWSPSCGDGASRRVELVLDVEAHATGDHVLALSALDVGFTHAEGIVWKRCADGQIVAPPPSVEGGECAGPAKQPCAKGLACDLIDTRQSFDELLLGMCVDPSKPVVAAATDEQCGGSAKIPCASGLLCHYTSASRAALSARGMCTPKGGAEGDRCGGSPVLACGSGLFCDANARDRCKPSQGTGAAN